ncbi:hypothetical protein [Streptomyces globisporus]|uniref:hypothetical protein n=1 Tax=Streptomyces globisporus TaxID=1908 RepID=UPI001B356CFE
MATDVHVRAFHALQFGPADASCGTFHAGEEIPAPESDRLQQFGVDLRDVDSTVSGDPEVFLVQLDDALQLVVPNTVRHRCPH